jgi:hypothetical protein
MFLDRTNQIQPTDRVRPCRTLLVGVTSIEVESHMRKEVNGKKIKTETNLEGFSIWSFMKLQSSLVALP